MKYSSFDDSNLCKLGSRIQWYESIGREVTCFYGENRLEFNIKITDYNAKKHQLTIEYENKTYLIHLQSLKKGYFGSLFKKTSADFKVTIGQRFKYQDTDITITNMYRKKIGTTRTIKYVKYHCNICGLNNGEMPEDALLRESTGCSLCKGQKAALGINTVFDLDPWYTTKAIGEELAKQVRCGSEIKVLPICPYCEKKAPHRMMIATIYNKQSVGCLNCESKGISIPNRMLWYVLVALKDQGQVQEIDREYWIEDKKYDGYFEKNQIQYLIEADGGLSHGKKEVHKFNINRERCIENDIKKDMIAKIDNKKLIRIDVDYPDANNRLDYIEKKIKESELRNICDLTLINWEEIKRNTIKPIIFLACSLKKENPELFADEIGKLVGIGKSTAIMYLKQGTQYGWCYYNPLDERQRGIKLSKEGKRRVI